MFKPGGFLFLLLLWGLHSAGQYFQTGQDPAFIRWRQVNTENFQLIYPGDYEVPAQRIAGILEEVYPYGGYSLNHVPRKIPVILHTHTVRSNGLLAWAPKRVEMYTIPHQSMYSQDWLEQLAIHEFRHVVQMDKVAQSLPRIIPFLLAQQGTALVTGAYLPFWFLEGDAVVTETALSKAGRGRLPSFLMEIRAQAVQKGIYGFDKAYLGSYKDLVPNHYKMGYYLVGEARSLYGPELWEKTVTRVGEKPFSFTPFRSAVKEVTGMNQRKLYERVFDRLRQEWQQKDEAFENPSFTRVTKPVKIPANYRYNFMAGTDTVLTLKDAFNEVPHFTYVFPDSREKKLLTPGTIFNESVGKSGPWLCWSEQLPDLRWEHSGRSLIHILNLETGEKQKLKPHYKGFSPDVSPDEKRIALIEVDATNNYYLSIYQLSTGKCITRYQADHNPYLITPKWISNNELVMIRLNDRGKSLVLVNPFRKEITILTENMGEIEHPVVKGEEVYFISSYAGKNDLYVLNTTNRKVFRVCNSRFGVAFPAVSGKNNQVVLSDYTSEGFRLIKITDDKTKREPLEKIKKGTYPLADKLASQEKGIPDFSEITRNGFESKKYSKPGNLFHFHSWLPGYFDVNSYDLSPGVSFLSQNKLGTAETSIGYRWDIHEKTGKIYGKFSWKGWYPLLSLEVNNGKRRSHYLSVTHYTNERNEIEWSDTTRMEFHWGETTLELQAKMPLNLSRGKYYRLLQPEVQYNLTSRRNAADSPDWFTEGSIHSLIYSLYYHQIIRKAYQDLVPDFGLITELSYRHTPGSSSGYGNLTAWQIIGYFPGMTKNQGLVLYNGLQVRKIGNGYVFSDAIRIPRGYSTHTNNFMYSFSADYKLPLFYPDWSLGGLVYLKRLKASLFADYSSQKGDLYTRGEKTGNFSRSLSSYGVELSGDMHFLRFYAPVEMGVRMAYLPGEKNFYSGFLFSVDFTSF